MNQLQDYLKMVVHQVNLLQKNKVKNKRKFKRNMSKKFMSKTK